MPDRRPTWRPKTRLHIIRPTWAVKIRRAPLASAMCRRYAAARLKSPLFADCRKTRPRRRHLEYRFRRAEGGDEEMVRGMKVLVVGGDSSTRGLRRQLAERAAAAGAGDRAAFLCGRWNAPGRVTRADCPPRFGLERDRPDGSSVSVRSGGRSAGTDVYRNLARRPGRHAGLAERQEPAGDADADRRRDRVRCPVRRASPPRRLFRGAQRIRRIVPVTRWADDGGRQRQAGAGRGRGRHVSVAVTEGVVLAAFHEATARRCSSPREPSSSW